ncbi:M16 family metallopeptidase [Tomitella gaofuii]|uniref:M16 family metallopeptidase n=1 Tax=Tomitella gaofuii TaxID=2760083 RepID=UPI0015F7B25B|nr:pitrilysin family protein [Tomitella gaofuii]
MRVVTERLPGVRSAAVGLWVGVGSRDEGPNEAGAAHFLEHLLFKRTPTRTAQSVAVEMDAVGGELNAFTTKEYTCFYAHVLDEDAALAIDVVADVALRGACDPADVDLEREVVLEEIAMREDDPEDLVGDLLVEAVLGRHPLARPVIGSAGSIESMTAERIRAFHRGRYRPQSMVLAVAGNVDHDDVVRRALAATGGDAAEAAAPAPIRSGRAAVADGGRLVVHPHDGEQVHLAIGIPTFGRSEAELRWPLAVLNHAVGGGLSSRLFQEIRESRGLAYSVYSGIETFADAGVFSVYAGCRPDNLAEVAVQVHRILESVGRDGLSEDECARSRGALRGGMVLGLEDSGARMNRLGAAELARGQHTPLSESLDRIAAVTRADVLSVARELLGRPRSAVVVGPFADAAELPAALTDVLGTAPAP